MKRYSFLHTDFFASFVKQFAAGTAGGSAGTVFNLSPALGEGLLSVMPISSEADVLFLDIVSLEKDWCIDFLSQPEEVEYFIRVDDVAHGSGAKNPAAGTAANREHVPGPGVTFSSGRSGHKVIYSHGIAFRSLIIRVRKNKLPSPSPDSNMRIIAACNELLNDRDMVLLPINFKYRLLLQRLAEEVRTPFFPEQFMVKDTAFCTEVFCDQVFYHLDHRIPALDDRLSNDVVNLLQVERYLADYCKSGFPGVQKLSRLSMMSPTKLKSAFRRLFGYTLFDYFQQYKLGLSRMMLEKATPVKIVAAEFGYSNPSHFAVAFRKEFGITPSGLDDGAATGDMATGKDDLKLMSAAEEFIASEYCSEGFTVKLLVRQIPVNYNRLNGLFKNKYGMNVSEFIRLKRIEKSKDMIAGGDKTISQIAYEIGYSSISNYILAFKKIYRVTPGSYKRQLG